MKRLVNTGIYHYVEHLSFNVPLIQALEQTPSYANFVKDMIAKKRSVSFEDDD